MRHDLDMTNAGEIASSLRAELRARPLDAAASCPSWRVYADWLLAQGDPRGEWLALALDPACAAACERVGETQRMARAATLAPDHANTLAQLWRGKQGWLRWLGPFALAAIQPSLSRVDFDAALGHDADLLLPERAWLGSTWLTQALERRIGTPTLLALDDLALLEPMVATLSRALPSSYAGHQYIVASGEPMPQPPPPPPVPINPGPVYDPEAMRRAAARAQADGFARVFAASSVLLTCLDDADLARHADDWHSIAQLGVCVLVGPAALLERWPHAGRRIAPTT